MVSALSSRGPWDVEMMGKGQAWALQGAFASLAAVCTELMARLEFFASAAIPDKIFCQKGAWVGGFLTFIKNYFCRGLACGAVGKPPLWMLAPILESWLHEVGMGNLGGSRA